MSGQDTDEPMDTGQPQNSPVNPSDPAQDNVTNPHTSTGEHTQPSATHRPSPEQLHSQQGQQYPMGDSFKPAQNNFTNLHTSGGQFAQGYQNTSANMPIGSAQFSAALDKFAVCSVQPSATQGSFPVQGQHPNAMGNSLNPAPIIFTIPHPSAGQFQQAYQNQSVNMPIQGQHQYVLVDPSNPAQNNFTNLHPSAAQFLQQGQHQYILVDPSYPAQDNFTNLHLSAGQFPQQGQYQYATGDTSNPAANNLPNPHPFAAQFQQAYQNPSMNMPTQGQHPNATGDSFNSAQNNFTNLHPSAVQFQQVPQDTSVNAEVKKDQLRRHQDASVKSFDATQTNSTHPDTSAGQVAQVTQDTSPNIGSGMAGFEQPPTSENKDEVRAIFSVQWSDGDKPQKEKSTLQKDLQSLANKSNFKGDCTVLKVSEDGRAEIKIKPAAAVSDLKELLRKPMKTKDGKTVTITYISMTLPELEIQTPDNASVDHSPSSVSEPPHVKGQFDTATSTRNISVHTDSASITRPFSSVSERQHVKGQLGEQSNMTTSTNVPKLTDNDNSRQEVNLPSSSVSEKQNDQELPVEQNGSSSSAAVSTREEKTGCVLPVVHFWYVNNIFKEDIKRIEREHGVKMNAEVNVTFVGNQKDEGLAEALFKFTDLVQKRLSDFDGSITPLKFVDTEEFKDTLNMIQRPEHKLLVALSSEEITIYGSKPFPTAISKALNAAQTSSANTYNSAAESHVTSLNVGMSITDHLVNNGLTIQESHWKLMTTSYSDDVDKIKDKFGVDFKDSGVHHGKVNVKAHYKRSGGNASMESHAIRALLHLCQKIATSPKNITQHQGATGFSGPTKSSRSSSEGASSGPGVNSQSEYSSRKTEDSTREGATAGDNKDEECPICKDTFNNRTQLQCKHEFCEECLERSKKHMGPVCPVCKDVFGVIEGTQPDGKMSSYEMPSSLPGFKNYGTIVITYDIPGGKQKERHPNPGQRYHGTRRTAYLPDNKEGREVLSLLRKAFNQKLIFTVGTSTTTGIDNQVTWNDIHHKTSMYGGPESFGYPDPDYLRRVRDELKAKGIE